MKNTDLSTLHCVMTKAFISQAKMILTGLIMNVRYVSHWWLWCGRVISLHSAQAWLTQQNFGIFSPVDIVCTLYLYLYNVLYYKDSKFRTQVERTTSLVKSSWLQDPVRWDCCFFPNKFLIPYHKCNTIKTRNQPNVFHVGHYRFSINI